MQCFECQLCHQQTSLVDVNCTVTVIIRFRLPPELTPHIPPPAQRRGRGRLWRLSGRLLDLSKNAIFTRPTCIWRPRWEFVRSFVLCGQGSSVLWTPALRPAPLGVLIPSKFTHVKLESLGYRAAFWDSTFSRFYTIPSCDKRTDRQTDGNAMTANTALA